MAQKRRSERTQRIGDLPLEVVQDQPGTFRHGGRLELVVEGFCVSREKSGRLRQTLQQVIDGRNLLIETEREGFCGFQCLGGHSVPLARRTGERQSRGNEARRERHDHEDQGHPPAKLGR